MNDTSGAQKGGAAQPVRIDVQVLFYSETLTPEEISSRFGLQPTRSTQKGIKIGKRTGHAMNIPRHMWQLSSESHVSVLELTGHLDWVLAKLFPVREQLRALRESGTIECVLVGVVWTNNTGAYIRLPVKTMEMLVALQLDLQMEFADYGDG